MDADDEEAVGGTKIYDDIYHILCRGAMSYWREHQFGGWQSLIFFSPGEEPLKMWILGIIQGV